MQAEEQADGRGNRGRDSRSPHLCLSEVGRAEGERGGVGLSQGPKHMAVIHARA